jgi:hypothetical protein
MTAESSSRPQARETCWRRREGDGATGVGGAKQYASPRAPVGPHNYLQVVPLTAKEVGTALVVLFQLPLKPTPL